MDFEAEETGEYNVWALTRDWTKVWDVKNPAGQFEINDGVIQHFSVNHQ